MKVKLEECDVCREVDYCVEVEGLVVCSNCLHKIREEEVDYSEEDLYHNQSSIYDFL